MSSACLPERINPLACKSGNLHHRIAGTFIDLVKSLKHLLVAFTVEIDLVENDCNRNIVHLACHKDSVKERKLDFREIYRSDYECAIQIGRNYMRLTRKIGRLSDDVVPAWLD